MSIKGEEKSIKYLPRHEEIGEISLLKMLVIAFLAFLSFTIIASAIHEIGIVVMTAILGGTVIHTTISWFWGATNISGSLLPWQMFLVMSSGTLFVTFFMLILVFYPEPLYTNITATVLGFRNLIDGAPFLSGSDGFQAAKISPIGAWIWYGFLFLVFAWVVAYSFGYKVDFRKGWD